MKTTELINTINNIAKNGGLEIFRTTTKALDELGWDVDVTENDYYIAIGKNEENELFAQGAYTNDPDWWEELPFDLVLEDLKNLAEKNLLD